MLEHIPEGVSEREHTPGDVSVGGRRYGPVS